MLTLHHHFCSRVLRLNLQQLAQRWLIAAASRFLFIPLFLVAAFWHIHPLLMGALTVARGKQRVSCSVLLLVVVVRPRGGAVLQQGAAPPCVFSLNASNFEYAACCDCIKCGATIRNAACCNRTACCVVSILDCGQRSVAGLLLGPSVWSA